MYYPIESKRFLVCFFNSGDTVRIMFYEINNDAFIYEDSYNEDYNDDYTIKLYSQFSENFLFIPTQKIDENNLQLFKNILSEILGDKNIVSIKSELNNDRKKAIIWWNFEGDDQTSYGNYNFNDWAIDIYSSKISNACTNSIYEQRINVFPYKNQTAFICTMEDENIQIVLYNKTDLMNDSFIINASCENNNELSKLYFNDKKKLFNISMFKSKKRWRK